MSSGDENESSNLSDSASDVDNSKDGSIHEAVNGNNVEGPIRRKTSADRTAKLTPKRKAAQKCEVAERSHYFNHDSDENGSVLNKGRAGTKVRGRGHRRARG